MNKTELCVCNVQKGNLELDAGISDMTSLHCKSIWFLNELTEEAEVGSMFHKISNESDILSRRHRLGSCITVNRR